MPRKLDSETRVHFRSFQDEAHSQKRAFCLHCNKDACADNIQRMKNHLLRCESYLTNQLGQGNEPAFPLQMDGPVAPDNPPMIPGMGQHAPAPPPAQAQGGPQPGSMPDDGAPPGPPQGPQDPNASAMGEGGMPPTTPAQTAAGGSSSNNNNNNNNTASVARPTPLSTVAAARAAQSGLEKVRQAMGRSTRRLEGLEAVLKTQVQDSMHNAATHVRAAIRDEKDRLFKLSQNLVRQEQRAREAQSAMGTF